AGQAPSTIIGDGSWQDDDPPSEPQYLMYERACLDRRRHRIRNITQPCKTRSQVHGARVGCFPTAHRPVRSTAWARTIHRKRAADAPLDASWLAGLLEKHRPQHAHEEEAERSGIVRFGRVPFSDSSKFQTEIYGIRLVKLIRRYHN